MGDIISVLLFVYLTFITLWYAIGKVKIIKSPFDANQQICLSGAEYSVVLLFATALFACGNLLSTRLVINELLCVVILFRHKRDRQYPLPVKIYILYMLWLVIGCQYADYPIYGLRTMIKYIYPLLVVLVCSRVVRNPEVAVTSGILACKVGVFAAIMGIFSIIENTIFGGVLWYGTARAINLISLMIFSLALFCYETDNKKWNLIMAIFFMIPCFLWVLRTSIIGTFIALAMFSIFKYKIKAIPVLVSLVVAGVICVFMIPSLNKKMFFDKEITFEEVQEKKLDDKIINTNGRTALWKYLEQIFYEKHKWTGSGTGSVQHEMYTNSEFYGGLKVPHSDYVQMLCDNGRIGLMLYLLAMGTVIIHCFSIYNKQNNKYIRMFAIMTGGALAGVLVTLYSDNAVNYSMCTLSFPMGFYGMTLGLMYAEEDKKFKGSNNGNAKTFGQQ